MKKVFVVVALMGLSAVAFAGEHYEASKTACSQLQSALKTDGSVTVDTWLGSNVYYSSPSSCSGEDEVAVPAYELSKDSLLCSLGYICRVQHQH